MASINDNEKLQNCNIPEAERGMSKSLTQLPEGFIELEDILLIRNEMNKLQEFHGEMYQKINSKLQNEIISPRKPVQEVASSVFGTDDSEGYSSLVYDLVKRAVDTKVNQMAKKHEDSINKINETWETKIKNELDNNNQFRKRCEKLEKENILLREKFAEHSRRLSLEKDAHWQAKLDNIENFAKLELKTKYENEIANLKLSLDSASKERTLAEERATLSRQVKDLKTNFQGQKNEIVKEFENKLSLLGKELNDRRDAERAQRLEIFRANLQLMREKILEEPYREEIADLHKYSKVIDEMKKIKVARNEELCKLKATKEKNTEALHNHSVCCILSMKICSRAFRKIMLRSWQMNRLKLTKGITLNFVNCNFPSKFVLKKKRNRS